MSQKNDFWSKRAAKYDADIRNHDAAYTRRIRKTRSLLNKSDVVLDFGCASGEIGLDIAPHVLHVLGIDPAGGMIELANEKTQNREINNARFSPIDVFDPSLTGQSFSVILAFSVFHLLDDIPKILDRLHELLTPGGLLISETPCLGERGWIIKKLIQLAMVFMKGLAVSSLKFADLDALVSDRGFEITESATVDKKDAMRWIVAKKV